MLRPGSPMTSKRVWALFLLYLAIVSLFALGMSAEQLEEIVKMMALSATTLIAGESLKDTMAESKRPLVKSDASASE